MTNIYALLTARAGSKSVPNKNIMHVGDHPLFYHNVLAAQGSTLINGIYVTTDCPVIKGYSNNYTVIDRPLELCDDDSSHHQVILHGLEEIEKDTSRRCDLLVVLLGNANGATSDTLDRAIRLVLSNDDADSVLSVSEFNMFNPFRSFEIANGELNTIVPQALIVEKARMKNINDKKSAGDCYFFNGAFMICRPRAIRAEDGALPFPWLGKKILPHVMTMAMEVDADWQVTHLEKK